MNWILPVVSVLSLAISLLRSTVDWVNFRHAERTPVPAGFEALFDEEKQNKALAYLGAQTRYRIFERSVWTIATLIFLWLGGFVFLDSLASSLTASPLLRALAYFAGLAILGEIFSLPFSWYSTFRLEERFGFNRSTVGTFLGDLLKGWLLGIVLGGLLLTGVLWFFLHAGNMAWIWVWAVLTAFQLVMGFLAPVLLMPLFNKFSPLPNGELKTAIEAYAAEVKFRLQGIFTMDGSKRSSKANAYFTGLGSFRRIVLFDTLVKQHSVKELVAILAHEVGHFKKGHIVKSLFFSFFSSLVLLFLLSRLLASQEIALGMGFREYSLQAGLTAAAWFFGPLTLLLGIAMQARSRANEFEADAFAVETTGNASELADALQRLSADHLANLNPHPWKVWLEYSHPPLVERLKAIRGSR